jgi:hypothetical protein
MVDTAHNAVDGTFEFGSRFAWHANSLKTHKEARNDCTQKITD